MLHKPVHLDVMLLFTPGVKCFVFTSHLGQDAAVMKLATWPSNCQQVSAWEAATHWNLGPGWGEMWSWRWLGGKAPLPGSKAPTSHEVLISAKGQGGYPRQMLLHASPIRLLYMYYL